MANTYDRKSNTGKPIRVVKAKDVTISTEIVKKPAPKMVRGTSLSQLLGE